MQERAGMSTFLLTNDDGVLAEGLIALREVVQAFGKVIVVAPLQEQSGKSHGITLHRPLRLQTMGEEVYGVEGTPADSVLLGLKCILAEKPDWVLSGINAGGNLGNDTLYSGTVAAAVEAAVQGSRSIAFSLHGHRPYDFSTAKKVVEILLTKLKTLQLAPRCCMNINIPNIPFSEIKGFRTTSLGRRLYEERIHERQDPRGRSYYWIGTGAPDAFASIQGSDCDAVHQGYVSISMLKVDYYDKKATEELSSQVAGWKL